MGILDTDELILRQAGTNLGTRTSGYELAQPSGELLATVEQDVRPGLVGRLLTERPGLRRAELEVLDPSGARMLGIAKARSRLGGVNVAVSLTDGRPIGSAVATSRRDVTLYDPAGAELGRTRRDSAVLTTLLDAAGAEIGTIARQLRTLSSLAAGQSAATTYELRFAPSTPVAVRALSIAYAVAGALQRVR